MDKLYENDLTSEEWREYELQGGKVYRIENPVRLFIREGGSTQRVLDSNGIVHCLPGPGFRDCVLRWKSKDPIKPVDF